MTSTPHRPEGSSQAAPPWRRLGERNAIPPGAAGDVELRDRCARAGVRLAPAVLVPHETFELCMREGLLARDPPGHVVDPKALLARLALPAWHRSLVVETLLPALTDDAFVPEDAVQDVEPNPDAIAEALGRAWAVFDALPVAARRDLLLSQVIAAEHGGEAWSERAFEDDLVELHGARRERRLLPKRAPLERPAPGTPQNPVLQRLQSMLRDVRRALGDGDWHLRWADDGAHCVLVDVRPLTRPPRRDELLSRAPLRPLLPDPPSRLTASLVAGVAGELPALLREVDPTLPLHRPLVELVAGRPAIDISLLAESLRHMGLPTTLICDALGTGAGPRLGWHPTRLVRKLPALARMVLQQLGSARFARARARHIRQRAEHLSGGFFDTLAVLHAVASDLAQGLVMTTLAQVLPLALLRRAGAIEVHDLGLGGEAARMWTELLQLAAQLDDPSRESLAKGALPASLTRAWEAFLERHGHRALGECDVARPRLKDDPEPILKLLAHPPAVTTTTQRAPLLRLVTLPLAWRVRAPQEAAEILRDEAMRALARIRTRLLELAEEATERGQLSRPDDLWLLTMHEARRLDDPSTVYTEEQLSSHRHEVAELAHLEVPDLVHRMDDPARWLVGGAQAEGTRLTGEPLGEGAVQGRAWVLVEPSAQLPPGFDPKETVLVARALDASWLPALAQVRAVVVESHGDVWGGALLLRQLGLRALVGVRGATLAFRTGDRLEIHADSGVVERLGEETALGRTG